MPMMDQEMPDEEMDDTGSEKETVSAFVPMSFFSGRTVKAGDMEKVKVVDVDPETGEAQIECVYGNDDEGESKGYESDFDRAMPEETEE